MKAKGWGKKFHANCNQKRAEVAILISAKIDVKSKKFTRVKEGHYVLIKGSIVIPYWPGYGEMRTPYTAIGSRKFV